MHQRSVRNNGAAIVAGTALFGLSASVARDGEVGPAEAAVLHAVNHQPEWLYPLAFIVQQAGNLIVAVIIVLGAALLLRRLRLAVAGLTALGLKLLLERAVKAMVERSRPGTSTTEVILRGDVSAHGLSFVSGHAILTTVLAMLLTPWLPARWRFVPWVVVVLNGLARMYVGAHNALDIVGGVGIGLVIGGVVNLAFRPRPEPQLDEVVVGGELDEMLGQ